MDSLLTVWVPGRAPQVPSGRLGRVLEKALDGLPFRLADTETLCRQKGPGPVLFCLPLDANGLNPDYFSLLAALRGGACLLEGWVGGLVVDGEGELYTKAVARELVLAANRAGCAFVGRPLVEATGSLENFRVRAGLLGAGLEDAYREEVKDLAGRLLAFRPLEPARPPRLLVIHASNRSTSNTLALWQQVRQGLEGECEIQEIGLRNGTLEDCAGCPYKTCLHFGEQGSCFYGGVMVRQVYPAVSEADAILLLCPNYNDAVSANLTAFINRLTALFRTRRFYDKALFALVVSGYSGSDLVAQQLISALNMNKSFFLPPHFCLMETANDAGAALRLPGIETRTAAFARNIRQALGLDGKKA